jgi:hypothetical protein
LGKRYRKLFAEALLSTANLFQARGSGGPFRRTGPRSDAARRRMLLIVESGFRPGPFTAPNLRLPQQRCPQFLGMPRFSQRCSAHSSTTRTLPSVGHLQFIAGPWKGMA